MNESRFTHPRIAIRRCGWSLAVALTLVTAAVAEAQAQTVPTADAGAASQEIQVFRHPSGVEIHVLQLRPGIGDDEMIDALESAAQLLRDSRNVTPIAHEEPAPTRLPDPPPPAPTTETAPTTTVQVPLPPPTPVDPPAPTPESAAAPPTVASLACETAPSENAHWFDNYHLDGLPATLLWQPPMANARQPRLALNLTSLKNSTTQQTVDTTIGGELGLFRLTPVEENSLVIEPDFFAFAMSRFSFDRDFTAADFSFGFPLTFAYENWHAKFGYEHLSTHLGDDYVKDTGMMKEGNVHNEIVCGLDYVFAEQLRIYGVFGAAFSYSTPTPSQPERYDLGVEWSRNQTTDWRGQPFAALDLEFRGDQNFVADTTLQLGWQWKEIDTGRSFRTGVELYDGRSPYGQFYLIREKWVGYGVWIDF